MLQNRSVFMRKISLPSICDDILTHPMVKEIAIRKFHQTTEIIIILQHYKSTFLSIEIVFTLIFNMTTTTTTDTINSLLWIVKGEYCKRIQHKIVGYANVFRHYS